MSATLDRTRSYVSQAGRISSVKERFGTIEWYTERSGMPSVQFEVRDCPFDPNQGDDVAFSATWSQTHLCWVALEVQKMSPVYGITFNTRDRKSLVIRSGRNRNVYLVPDSERCPHGVLLRAGDRVKFFPQTTTFLPDPELRALHVSIIATGVVESLVEGPDSLPGRRVYSGCYIKWRQCEDAKGAKPPDDKIFHIFKSEVEARYVQPGMRARCIPMLSLKKSMKRLNLTSKFGSLVCVADGIVSELPEDGYQAPPPTIGQGGRKRSDSVGSNSSVSSANMISIGKIKLLKQSPGASVNFTLDDMTSRLDKRPLRAGDRVEVKFTPNHNESTIDVGITLVLEGSLRLRGGSSDALSEFDTESGYEIVCKSDDASDPSELVYQIDYMNDEAVLGFLPLYASDRVRFHVNENGYAEAVSVISEVPGRIKTVGNVVLRGDPLALAAYPPKTFTKLGPGTWVLARIDWQDTHFRILQMRVDPNASRGNIVAPQQSSATSALKQAAADAAKKKQKKQQQQKPMLSSQMLAVPRPTAGYVEHSPPQPTVKFHGAPPGLPHPPQQQMQPPTPSPQHRDPMGNLARFDNMLAELHEAPAGAKSGWAAVASTPARPAPTITNPNVGQFTPAPLWESARQAEPREAEEAQKTHRGGKRTKAMTAEQQDQNESALDNLGQPKLPNLTAHIAAVVDAAEKTAAFDSRLFGATPGIGGEEEYFDDDEFESFEDEDSEFEYPSSDSDLFADSEGDHKSGSEADRSYSANSSPKVIPAAAKDDRLFSEADEVVLSPRKNLFQWPSATHSPVGSLSPPTPVRKEFKRTATSVPTSPLQASLGSPSFKPASGSAETNMIAPRVGAKFSQRPQPLDLDSMSAVTETEKMLLDCLNNMGILSSPINAPTFPTFNQPSARAQVANENANAGWHLQDLARNVPQNSSSFATSLERSTFSSDHAGGVPLQPTRAGSGNLRPAGAPGATFNQPRGLGVPNASYMDQRVTPQEILPTNTPAETSPAAFAALNNLNNLLQAIQDHARAAQESLRTQHNRGEMPAKSALTPKPIGSTAPTQAPTLQAQSPTGSQLWSSFVSTSGFVDWRSQILLPSPTIQGVSPAGQAPEMAPAAAGHRAGLAQATSIWDNQKQTSSDSSSHKNSSFFSN